jgi:HD-like signal output (HDOD) protein
MSRREEIIAKAKALPLLPLSVSSIVPLVQTPDSSLVEIAEVLKLDPGLTVNVLRLANSPHFNPGMEQVSSMREAVFRLGLNRVKQLVISTAAASRLRNDVRGYNLGPGELLRHSVALAMGAEMVAKHLHIAPPEYTFTAGLLANIGKVVLGEFLAAELEPVLNLVNQESFEQAEREVLGIDNAELGAMVLAHWGLPDNIVNCVRWRLEPGRAPQPETALDLVHVGHVLASMIGVSLGLDGLSHGVCKASFDRLGLSAKVLTWAMEDVVTNLNDIEGLFS